MQEITLLEMLKSGVHFGHQKKYWHPKMKPYIHTNRAGLYIIDLEKTEVKLKEALEYIKKVVSQNSKILFVSTKRQAHDIVKKTALEVGMPYATDKWIGGTLTNFDNIKKLVNRLKDLRKKKEKGELEKYTKREQLKMDEEMEYLELSVGGIQDMEKMPAALFIIDMKKEKTAVREATKMNIPIIAMCDTNVNPELADYPIPSNDDATKSIKLIVGAIQSAIKDGQDEKTSSTKVSSSTNIKADKSEDKSAKIDK
ncbi:MAG: 30S ribosomal protein S2 [bacterium]|nr:30S ribosomal protein S2 [bacterium]